MNAFTARPPSGPPPSAGWYLLRPAALHRRAALGAVVLAAVVTTTAATAQARGALVLQVHDGQSSEPARARLVLRSATGRTPRISKGQPAGQGVVVDGEVELVLPDGAYQFELFRGPEYRITSGTFQLERTSFDTHAIHLERFVDMRSEGWISGDLGVDHPARSLPLLMDAADLHVAATVGTGEASPPAEDTRLPIIRSDVWPHDLSPGLLVIGGEAPAAELPEGQPVASLFAHAAQAESEGIVVTDLTSWELPIWLASGRLTGVMVLGPQIQLEPDPRQRRRGSGRPPSLAGYTDPQGAGRWAEYVYWQMLEAGLRIPPIAGSGGTANGNPVGYNRVYVHCDPNAASGDDLADRWWRGLWTGRSVITNGPLLRPQLGGKWPGETFHLMPDEAVRMALELRLGVRDPVDYLDVIRNGQVIYSARLDEFAEAGGRVPEIDFSESAWITCRVVTSYPDHYRMAFSAPWHIEFEGHPRISRAAVQFFIDWLEDYVARLRQHDRATQEAAAPYVIAARQFWNQRLEAATVP